MHKAPDSGGFENFSCAVTTLALLKIQGENRHSDIPCAHVPSMIEIIDSHLKMRQIWKSY